MNIHKRVNTHKFKFQINLIFEQIQIQDLEISFKEGNQILGLSLLKIKTKFFC
jgi:predicted nucleotidyltransferase